MAIEGPLRELGIEEVLQLLDLAHKTGVLSIRSNKLGDEAIVHFLRGTIVFAVRRRSPRRLGVLLIRAGRLTQRELERALEIQRTDPGRRLAEILLDMGLVNGEELERQLQFQIEETLYEVMSWDEGYFRFEDRNEIPQSGLNVAVKVESILMEGARRVDEWSRLEARVPSPDVIPVLATGGDVEAAPIDLNAEEWEVLAEIDGERDLRQVAASLARSTFDVAHTVFELVSRGVVQVHEKHARIPELRLREAMGEVEAMLRAGDADGAQKLAANLEAAHPERAELSVLCGRTLEAQGRGRAAVEAFQRAVELDPLSADAHFRLGRAALGIGDFERAAESWSAYLTLSQQGARREMVNDALSAVRLLRDILERDEVER